MRQKLPLRNLEEVKKKEVAKEAGISVASYSNAELGVIPGEKVLTRIARHFNVSEDYLLGKKLIDHPKAPTVRDQVTPHIKENVVSIGQAKPDLGAETPNIGGQFVEDINHLKVIYDYGDFEIINAIHSNLKTFNRTVQREIEVKELKQKVSRLEEENAEQKARIDKLEHAVEQLLAKQPAAQEKRKTGTNA